MMQNINYQKELEKEIKKWSEQNSPTILLHCCCAPCSSYCMEYLNPFCKITAYYYNPNITDKEEYDKRVNELKRLIDEMPMTNKASFLEGPYEPEAFLNRSKGLENEPERGRRCEKCFALRLLATARKAQELGVRYFSTTLASSRWKNLEQINRAGLAAEQEIASVCFWGQNWRKGGLQERRNQLLKAYGFYNQQYCGCEFSKQQRENLK